MTARSPRRVRALAAAAWLMALEGAAAAQPAIDVPPEEPRKAIPRPPGLELPRESEIEVPISGASSPSATAIGAYSEILLEAPIDPPANPDPDSPIVDPDHVRADVRRLVVFLGHNFTEHLRAYTELEVEHAVASSGDQGEFEIEQLFVDYLARRWMSFRAGLILMPIGIVNQYHEPPTFNGALRPETDTRIIPSTWREVGGGIFGGAGPVRWQLYGVTSFKALDFDAEGLREGHQEGQLARAKDWGVVGRIDLQPVPALDVGVAGYYSFAGQGDPRLQGAHAPVGLVEADVRFRWKGLEARAEVVNVWVLDSDRINQVRQEEAGDVTIQPVARQLRGGYVEAGYNLLQPLHLRRQSSLVVFGRYERTNTQAEILGGYAPAPGKDRQVITVGLNFRPIAEVSLKLDYQYFTAFAGGAEEPSGSRPDLSWSQLSAGLGFMF